MGHRRFVGSGVLPLCRDAVSVFYSPSSLGHRRLVAGVLPLYRDAISVFYSPSRLDHRKLVGGVLLLCRDAVGVFYSSNRQGHKRPVGRGVLPLCSDAVGVFYRPSWLDCIILKWQYFLIHILYSNFYQWKVSNEINERCWIFLFLIILINFLLEVRF